MSDYDVEQAAELAAQAFLRKQAIAWVGPGPDDEGGPDRIYCGMEGRETAGQMGSPTALQLPCIICACQSAQPVLPNYHGNWNAELVLEIRSNADDTTGATENADEETPEYLRQSHAARVRQVSRLIYTTEIAQDLSTAIPEFYVAKVVPGPRQWERVERSWVTRLQLSLVSCCATQIRE